MKFKEFAAWCNRRAADGKWGSVTAMTCCNIASDIYKLPRFKRQRVWHNMYEEDTVKTFVIPTNEKIMELDGCNNVQLSINGTSSYKQFLKLLAYIEWCGNVGHTPKALKLYIDGDGTTRLRFNFKDYKINKEYENIRKQINADFNENGKDMQSIGL